jgi:hypothetical protein
MNISRPVLPILLVVLTLLATAMPRGFGSAEDHEQEALVASKNWIAQIDAGNYEESYAFTCDALRDKVPIDHWVDVLKSLRTPWGSVASRKQTSHIYKPNGVHGLSGECMVITYDTMFQKMPNATEEIVLLWDDGKWRGAGYNAGPKPTDDAAAPPSDSSTETHTEPHVKPEANTP